MRWWTFWCCRFSTTYRKMGKEIKGYKDYRYKDNPKEKELHDKFIEHFAHGNNMDHIVFGGDPKRRYTEPGNYLSGKEKRIVVSIIQWLGSPVGQGFLRDCGFELKKDK